ncbi:unnamed protein product [Spirodela intermedia]|uniref:Plant heme peroxidase family profile domain-containing protein n=1 Tax=Spirodela intermedia TaxID=51605 RepID=A0A7I8IE85_SPIIN|nr:unnamed protein product [Spirodela intermedia]CAA6656110.1 unnamed protein product [Spirodela intermedia]
MTPHFKNAMTIRGEIMFLALVLGMYLSATAEATLRVGYYEKTCPHAEFIVKKVITKAVKKDSGLPADFIRMHFHDCFVRSGGFVYEVPSGRRDGRISRRSETFGNLPPPTFNLSQLTQSFASKGLNLDDLVTLSGTKHINAHV